MKSLSINWLPDSTAASTKWINPENGQTTGSRGSVKITVIHSN